jgi:hypothetical protein
MKRNRKKMRKMRENLESTYLTREVLLRGSFLSSDDEDDDDVVVEENNVMFLVR